VLLGFPPHELTRLRLAHAFDLNLLDDHIATPDGGHDRFRPDVGARERALNRFGDDARVHHLAFHDGVGQQRSHGDAHELRLTLGVVDDRHLDQA
jgi:hypothetical protein